MSTRINIMMGLEVGKRGVGGNNRIAGIGDERKGKREHERGRDETRNDTIHMNDCSRNEYLDRWSGVGFGIVGLLICIPEGGICLFVRSNAYTSATHTSQSLLALPSTE